jgi:polar amino acid transport system permease protein
MEWEPIWEARGMLLSGLTATLGIAAVSLVTATAIGTLVGVLRSRHIKGLSVFLRGYVEIFRGSPLLVQLLLIYFGSAYAGIYGISPFVAVVIGLTLYEGAYISEIVRAGIEATPVGQEEASRSLGLTRLQQLWWVILPQAFRIVLPALIGQWTALIKDSALASVIGYTDLLKTAQSLYARTGSPFEVLLVVAVAFFIICLPMSLTAKWLEKRGARS